MKNIIAWLALLVAIGAVAVGLRQPAPANTADSAQPAFVRVMQSNTIRCGYYVFPPATYRDANTNQLSGFSVDLMEHLATNAGLKIDWTEEVTFGNWPAALQAGRVDAICTPLWPEVGMARVALFSQPHIYAAINAYVRGDDNRFTDIQQLNDPSVTILDQDGVGYKELIARYFPKAKVFSLPAGAPTSDLALTIMNHKADVILWDENGRIQFEQSKQGTLKQVNARQPLRVMPFVFGVNQGEHNLLALLNVGTGVMLDNGTVEELLAKWQMTPAAFLRIAPSYVKPQ